MNWPTAAVLCFGFLCLAVVLSSWAEAWSKRPPRGTAPLTEEPRWESTRREKPK